MGFQRIVGNPRAIQLGLWLAQRLPLGVGYGLARFAANLISWRKPEMYWIVRNNLRHILGPETDERTLDEKTRCVFYNSGRTHYDFFHALREPPHVVEKLVPGVEFLARESKAAAARGRGVLLLGTHMAGFDLILLSLGSFGLPIQILSVTDPNEGFRFQNRLRASAGFELTPITPESLRAALQRLKGGGIVATGVDWPVPEEREHVEFLGEPSYMPLGPARLALMSGAVVLMGSLHREVEGGYALDVEGPLEMMRSGNRQQDILDNTRRFARIVEGYVRANPEQWMMFHPFWPDQEPTESLSS